MKPQNHLEIEHNGKIYRCDFDEFRKIQEFRESGYKYPFPTFSSLNKPTQEDLKKAIDLYLNEKTPQSSHKPLKAPNT